MSAHDDIQEFLERDLICSVRLFTIPLPHLVSHLTA